VASSPWSYFVPFGWSVEWDPSPAGNDAMLWAKYGAYLCHVCSRVVISFPLPPLNNVS
jgi:hypothetical protein